MRHPREPRAYGRREFLQRSAVAVLGASSAGSLLAACGDGEESASPGGGTGAGDGGTQTDAPFALARRDNPV